MRRRSNVALVTVLGALAASVSCGGQESGEDPVELSPQYYTVRLENDLVRVLDYRLQPGEIEAMHSHSGPFVVHFITDATVRTIALDGTQAETTVYAAAIDWRDPLTHSVENIGDTDLHAVLVELKRR